MQTGIRIWSYRFTSRDTTRCNTVFEVELVACRPRKGSSVENVSKEKARLEELKKQRETAAAAKEEEKRKREQAKAAAAARVQAKLEAKEGQRGRRPNRLLLFITDNRSVENNEYEASNYKLLV